MQLVVEYESYWQTEREDRCEKFGGMGFGDKVWCGRRDLNPGISSPMFGQSEAWQATVNSPTTVAPVLDQARLRPLRAKTQAKLLFKKPQPEFGATSSTTYFWSYAFFCVLRWALERSSRETLSSKSVPRII